MAKIMNSKHNFFAYTSRMKLIKRWGLMRSQTGENLMEHSAETAMLAHALAVIRVEVLGLKDIDAGKVAVIALYHDSSEVLTGDLPTPVKYFNKDIKDAYLGLEQIAKDKLLTWLPSALKNTYADILNNAGELETKIVKAADRLAAYIKCIEDVKCGNSEFKKALKATRDSVAALNMAEVDYFVQNFIKSYELTLDELD